MKNKSIIFKFNIQRLEHFSDLIDTFLNDFIIIIYIDGDINNTKDSVKIIYEKLLKNERIVINESNFCGYKQNKAIKFFHKHCLNSFSQIFLSFYYIKCYNEEYNYFKNYLQAMNTKAIFIPDDRLRLFGNGMLKAAKGLNIKIILPYLYTCQKHSLVLFYKSRKYYKNRFTSLFQFFVFQRIAKQQQQQLYNNHFYYTVFVLFAQDHLGMLSDNPWCLGYGLSDVVCVDSILTVERLNKEIGPNSKFVVTGDIVFDKLYDAFINKEKMFEKYKQSDQKIVLISVAAFYETGLFSLSESQKKINFLIECVETLNVTILISFHPKVNILNYTYLKDQYSCIFIDEALYQVLPIANMMVNSVSSTINWAILCGVKSCILANMYDDSGLNEFYNQFKSVQNVYNDHDFAGILDDMLNREIDFTEDWNKLSKNEVFNGRTMERYKELVNE